jgi:ubiquinone/menaquinone biosynthesis C-methylase UbiE
VKQHVIDCETALGIWARRRKGDIAGFTVPRQNIAAVVARQDSLLRVLDFLENKLRVDLKEAQLLDVGCASGYGLTPFLVAGFSSSQLHGIDLFEDRIKRGRSSYPGLQLNLGDATEMGMFPDCSFDVVMEQFCFCHVQNDDTVSKIAKQMLRVVKPGGFILIHDWVVGSKKRAYNGISLSKIRRMFDVGDKTEIVARFPSKLFPPVGRLLSSYCPSLYPLVRSLLPFLTLSKFTVMRRK